MDRRTFVFVLNDGKEYTFAERNREDINYTAMQNKFRKMRINNLYDIYSERTSPSDIEMRDALIFQESGRLYDEREVWIAVMDDYEERSKLAYASFKIINSEVDFDGFKKLIDSLLLNKLLKMIVEIEKEDPALDVDVCSELKITQKQLMNWKKEYPEVYWNIKSVLKKKAEQKSRRK